MKYLKWAFGKDIAKVENKKFEIGKVMESDIWDPTNDDWDSRGGFNFTIEKCALRWMSRGDTLYEVEIPKDGELVKINSTKTPDGIYIANKIILTNPIPISNELLENFYNKSELPISTYFECIRILATRNYYDLALKIIKDKVNLNNIDEALEIYNKSLKPEQKLDIECYNKVKEILEEIKSDIDINLFIDKEPYIKEITNDNIINLTGQSGSGKSTYAKEHFNSDDYLIVDTDEILSDDRFKNTIGINKELGEYFRNKYDILPNCNNDFDLIYNEILNYCINKNKTIVIDCAQFHAIKNINILKGKMIIIRTSINTCYERTIMRYKSIHPNATSEEIQTYANRKKGIYTWYKGSNEFINKIEQI